MLLKGVVMLSVFAKDLDILRSFSKAPSRVQDGLGAARCGRQHRLRN